jgi:protein-tyrosine phosphatase
MSTPRHYPLPGTYNFREVGGYHAGSSTTKWGKLYRSDALNRLTDEARDDLRQRDIRTVIDLRDDEERRHNPSLLEGLPVRVVESPIFSGSASSFLASDITLARLYETVVTENADAIVRAIRVIASSGEEGGAVLVHCTAGKDRTGLVVAFALLAVGVDRQEVVADYAMTQQNLPDSLMAPIIARLKALHVPDSTTIDELVWGSPAHVLEETIDLVVRQHGSVRAFLTDNGLTDAELDDLAHVLLERA